MCGLKQCGEKTLNNFVQIPESDWKKHEEKKYRIKVVNTIENLSRGSKDPNTTI